MADIFNVGSVVGQIELEDKLTPAITQVAAKLLNVGRDVQEFGQKLIGLGRDGERVGGILNSTFGRIAVAAGGVVGAVGAIATSILELGRRGSVAVGIEDSFERLAKSAGVAGDAIANSLDKALQQTVDNTEQLEHLNKLLGANVQVSAARMKVLGEAARAVAKATGGDVSAGLNQMTTAVLRGSDMMLRRIGITANMREAEDKFAKSLGVTREELNHEGRLYARREAIFEAMRKYVEQAGVSQLSLGERIKQVQVAIGNWFEEIQKGIARSKDVKDAFDAVGDAIKRMIGSGGEKAIDIIIDGVNKFARGVKDAVPVVETIIGKIKDFWDWLKELNDRYQITERVSAAVRTAFTLLRKALEFVGTAAVTVMRAWSSMPEWMQTIARNAALTAVGLYAVGKAMDAVQQPFLEAVRTADLWVNVTTNSLASGRLLTELLQTVTKNTYLLAAANKAASVAATAELTAYVVWSEVLFRLGNTIPVLTARIWLLEAAEKASAIATAYLTAAKTTLAGWIIALSGTTPVLAARIWLLEASEKAAAVSAALMSKGTLAAAGSMTVLGTAILAVKYVLLPLTVLIGSYNLATALGIQNTKLFGLELHRWVAVLWTWKLGLSELSLAELKASEMADQAARSHQNLGTVLDQRAEEIKRIQRDLSGARIANEVDKLRTAYLTMTPAQQQAADTMQRVGEQASMLRQQGGRLHPELAKLADAYDEAQKSANGFNGVLDRGNFIINEAEQYAKQIREQFKKLSDEMSGRPAMRSFEALSKAWNAAPSSIRESTRAQQLFYGEFEKLAPALTAVPSKYRAIVAEINAAMIAQGKYNETVQDGIPNLEPLMPARSQRTPAESFFSFDPSIMREVAAVRQHLEAQLQMLASVHGEVSQSVVEAVNKMGATTGAVYLQLLTMEAEAVDRARRGASDIMQIVANMPIQKAVQVGVDAADRSMELILARDAQMAAQLQKNALSTASVQVLAAIKAGQTQQQQAGLTEEAYASIDDSVRIAIANIVSEQEDWEKSLVQIERQLMAVAELPPELQKLFGVILTPADVQRVLTGLRSWVQGLKTTGAAATEVTVKWSNQIGSLAQGFINLSHVSGGVFSEITASIGKMIVSLDNAIKGFGNFKDSFTKNGQVLKGVGLQMAASIGAGLLGGFSSIMEATNFTSGIKNVLSGSIAGGIAGAGAGAAIGTAIAGSVAKGAMLGGIWGAVAGVAVGAIVGYFRGREVRRIMHQVGEEWGQEVSKGLAEKLKVESKTIFKGSMDAAQIFNLDRFIEEGGGLNTDTFSDRLLRLRDTFVMLETGQFDASQATQVLDKNFRTFIDFVGGNVTPRLKEIIKLNDEFRTGSKEIAAYVAGEANKSLEGIGAFIIGRGEIAKRLTELQEQAKRGGSSREARAEMDRLKRQLEALPLDPAAPEAFGASLLGIFERLTRDGAPALAVINQIAPIIASLDAQLAQAGVSGGAAFEQIRNMAALATDEVKGPALQGIVGLGSALEGLNNSAILNQQMFAGITAQVGALVQAQLAQGATVQELYPFIASSLQTIWELEQDYGYQVDEVTQKILDQAEAEGVVGDQHRSVQEQMLLGIGRIVDAVEGLARAFGVQLPSDMDKAAHKAGLVAGEIEGDFAAMDLTFEASWKIDPFPELPKPPVVNIPTKYESPGKPPDPYEGVSGGGGEYYGGYYAAGGYVQPKKKRADGYAEGGNVVSLAAYKAARSTYMAVGGAVKTAGKLAASALLAASVAAPVYAETGLFVPKGTDTVPAMLTPREFVQPVKSVERYGLTGMEAIRRGSATVIVGGDLPKATINVAAAAAPKPMAGKTAGPASVLQRVMTVMQRVTQLSSSHAHSETAVSRALTRVSERERMLEPQHLSGGGLVSRARGYADGGLVTSIGGTQTVAVSVTVATDQAKKALESIGREPVEVDAEIDTSNIWQTLDELPSLVKDVPVPVALDAADVTITEKELDALTAARELAVQVQADGIDEVARDVNALPQERPLSIVARALGLADITRDVGAIPSSKPFTVLASATGLGAVVSGIASIPTQRDVTVPVTAKGLAEVIAAIAGIPSSHELVVAIALSGLEDALAGLNRIPERIPVAVELPVAGVRAQADAVVGAILEALEKLPTTITISVGTAPAPQPVPSPSKPKLPPAPAPLPRPDDPYRIPIPTPTVPPPPGGGDYRVPIPTPTSPWLSPWMTLSGGGIVTLAAGGIVPVYAERGFFVPRGTDTVPAMLTPHEYVLPSSVVMREGVGALDKLRAGSAHVVPSDGAGSMPVGPSAGATMATITQSREIVRERTERSEGGDVAIIVLQQGATIADVMAALPKRLAKNERQEAEKIAAKLQPYLRRKT